MPRANAVEYQNLLRQSEALNVAPWTNSALWLITGDFAANPVNGAVNADRLVTPGGGTAILFQSVTLTRFVTHCFSVWCKVNGAATNTWFLDYGTSSPVQVPTSSWQRQQILFEPQAGATSIQLRSSVDCDLLFWGAQLVRANWPGPYQPTTASAVNTGAIRNLEAAT